MPEHLRSTPLFVIAAVLFSSLFATSCGQDAANGPDRVSRLINAEPHPRLELHVDYVENRRYRDGAADRLVDSLDDLVDKPAGIEVVEGDELPAAAPEEGWTRDELRELVYERVAGLDVSDDAIDVYTLFVDGEYADGSGDGTVLGIAWANRYVVMFRDQIENACQNRLAGVPGIGDRRCENAELTIWRHELGHVLGLVNRGAPLTSDHDDPDSPAHCRHDDCVMYWAFRGPSGFDMLRDRLGRGEAVPDFDEACRADLDAVRN